MFGNLSQTGLVQSVLIEILNSFGDQQVIAGHWRTS
jgi:hypothetical protein